MCFHGVEEVCKLGVKGDTRKGVCLILDFLTSDLCPMVLHILWDQRLFFFFGGVFLPFILQDLDKSCKERRVV